MQTGWRAALAGSIAVGFAGLGLLASAQPAHANAAFAQASGKSCGTCHQPGRETEAPNSGFTASGQSFYNAFRGNCKFQMNCAVDTVFGTGAAAPSNSQNAGDGTTRTQSGMARFDDNCGGSSRFFIIRVAGNAGNEIRFKLKNGHKVHIEVPTGSVFAAKCGGFPGGGQSFSFIRLE